MQSDDVEMTDHECLQEFDQVFNEMMESINDGTLTDWAANRLAEKVVYIIAGRVYDPSEDYVFIGRESYLKWYNNLLGGQPSTVTWCSERQVTMLSREIFQVDAKGRAESDGVSIQEVKGRTYCCMREKRIQFVMRLPQCPEDDMSQSLLFMRSRLPESTVSVPKPPCRHAEWDSIRGKQSCVMLRCRECSSSWRLPADDFYVFRCPEFLAGTCPIPAGVCRRIHVHARKIRARERDAGELAYQPAGDKHTCDGQASGAGVGSPHDDGASAAAEKNGKDTAIINDLGFDPALWLLSSEGEASGV